MSINLLFCIYLQLPSNVLPEFHVSSDGLKEREVQLGFTAVSVVYCTRSVAPDGQFFVCLQSFYSNLSSIFSTKIYFVGWQYSDQEHSI